MASKQTFQAPKIVLDGISSGPRVHTARAAAICAGTLPPALFSVSMLLLVSACMDTATLACALACSVVSAALLGLMHEEAEKRGSSFAVPLFVVAAVSLAAILLLPGARAGLFALVNGVIDHLDETYDGHVPYLAGTQTCAHSPLFGACLGVSTSTLAWIIAGMANPAVVLFAAALANAVSIRLGLGAQAAAAGCVLGIGAWIARARVAQLPGSTYSLYSLALNSVLSAGACILLAVLVCTFWTPVAALDGLHEAVDAARDELRFGHDTLPEGDLTQAASMNTETEDERGLTITYTGTVTNDLYLCGYVGAVFDGLSWAPLDHTAYEGEWRGMTTWLAERGLVASQQRSAFDDAASAANAVDAAGTATVEIDASAANRRYAYVPYTLRELAGASLATQLEGSLAAGTIPAARYRETIDTVDRASVLAATDWLASSTSSYAAAERVYAAFVTENYLDVSETERQAVSDLIFNDATWNHADHTDYDVIARVRTMLQSLASYTEQPAAVNEASTQDGSFVRWLLDEAHEGNSAYFATAAVLAFRSQGIPARYTEGYLASSGALTRAATNEESLTLTARDAHAWAEVYLDGLGWTPIEVTPGFYMQSINADEVIDVGEAWNVDDSSEASADTAETDLGDTKEGDGATKDAHNLAARLISFVTPIPVSLLLLALIAQIQRTARIARWRKHVASKDQDVCVPTLYAYLAALMHECGIGFDEDRPLDCAGAFDGSLAGIDEKEYRRVIELYQSFTFGGCKLRANELRTLRRFNERLHSALPAPDGPVDALRRRFVSAL